MATPKIKATAIIIKKIQATAIVKKLIQATAIFKTITTSPLPPAIDPVTQTWIDAVIAAGGNLTQAEKDAVNVYIIDAQNNGNAWWDDTQIDLPMVGGNADGFGINAKNPGQFDVTWVNTIPGDFTANGWKPNGVNSYGKMGFIPSVQWVINNSHIAYYSRESGSDGRVWGCAQGSNQIADLILSNSNLTLEMYGSTGGTGLIGFSNTTSRDHYLGTRTGANLSIYKNGVQLATHVGNQGVLPTIEIYLAARNFSGTAGIFSEAECAGANLGTGLTTAQALALYNARQLMNTSLGRQV